MAFLGDYFTGNNDPPRPASGATQVAEAGPAGAPEFVGMSPEQRELLQFQLERMKKTAQFQDDTLASIERQFGQRFADVFAEQYKLVNDEQLRLWDEQAAATGYRAEFRKLYADAVGMTPGEVEATLAAREVQVAEDLWKTRGYATEVADEYMTRFRKAAAGESTFDPTLTRAIEEGRQQLDEQMRQQYGPGWESTQAGINRLRSWDTGVNETLYRARKAEMGEAVPYALGAELGLLEPLYTAAPATRRLTAFNPSIYAAGNPLPTTGSMVSYVNSPIPGANDLLGILQQGQNAQNAFNTNLYTTQYQGGIDLLNSYYGRQAAAAQQRFKAGSDLLGGLIGAGGAIGAAAI